MFWIYNFLLTITAPFWVPWMLWRANKRAEKVDWKQRSGEYRMQMRKGSDRIWFHAVSVGEVVAALPILREIRALAPDSEIVLSVTTSSGHSTAEKQAEGLYDHLVYFPIDVPRFCLGAMVKVKPKVVAVMETELWFNFFWAAKVVEAKTMVINGRVSDRSFPRSSKLKFFYKPLLAQVDEVLVQSPVDAERMTALGAQKTEVFGNCKFDQALEGVDADPNEWRKLLGIDLDRPVVVIGSTRGEFEEELVVKALSDERLANVQAIHAPRHLETVSGLADRVKRTFGSVALRSKGETGKYLILDTYGELSKVYSVADVVVIGGGFDKLGGQNLIQALAHGKPVIHGPNMNNFRDSADLALRAGASHVADSAESLAAELVAILGDSVVAESMGQAAKELVAQNLGASKRYAQRIVDGLNGDE
ncbi:MAG: hypothetical protein KF836_11800 [Fimbriimonadaceae bacterium]|nr:hypothetical protein [Fimbriimonadaceae bacterium]